MIALTRIEIEEQAGHRYCTTWGAKIIKASHIPDFNHGLDHIERERTRMLYQENQLRRVIPGTSNLSWIGLSLNEMDF